MKIHEYQAKELFAKYNIPVPMGEIAHDAQKALDIFKKHNKYPRVVKAQIHAGGRGKGGGVKLVHDKENIKKTVDEILFKNLITHQTGPAGQKVNKVLIEEGLSIEKELYLSFVCDRQTAKIVIMASVEGGMDIEEVALKTPEKIIKVYIDPLSGLFGFHCRKVGFGLGLTPPLMKQLAKMLNNMYKLFMAYDCSLIEINPLIITSDEKLIALDAKVNFDDNALFRQKEIIKLRDLDEEDPAEVEASKYNLNYIKMDGTIGNMVNGAGLAMATMDIIQLAGATPANFLDVGGGASADQVENGFRIILSDKNVKGILVNIFGGILRCDILAEGIVSAAKKTKIEVPIVIRMEGTNVEKGRKILSESGLNLTVAKDLHDAAQKVAQI